MRNPHNYLIRLTPKGEIGPWRCQMCNAEGLLEELRAVDCKFEYPPCKWCGQTPECAEDCVGIGLALSSPDVLVIGDADDSNDPNP